MSTRPSKSRRSMGTKPMGGAIRATRPSDGPDSAQRGQHNSRRGPEVGSTAKKGVSRLPRPFGELPGSQKRSSSSSHNAYSLTTPATSRRSRSQSSSRPGPARAARTPQVPQSSGRKVLQVQNTNRFSMSSQRSSFVGAKTLKDGRNLSDKSRQQDMQRQIVEFLNYYGYDKKLKTSDFPTSSTEFRNIFQFCIEFIIPGYEVPKKMELTLPDLLKKIGYPVQVSKSMFQTLGTLHSWPNALGVLHYLVGRAGNILGLQHNMEEIIFPAPLDEQGFPLNQISDDRLMFDHFVNCYDAFYKGKNSFEEELNELRSKLEASHNVNVDMVNRIENKRQAYHADLQQLESVPMKYKQVADKYSDSARDLEKMQSFKKQTEAYMNQKSKELEDTLARLQAQESHIAMLRSSIEELTNECKAKGIRPDAAQVDKITMTLRQQKQHHQQEVEDIEKRVWSKELDTAVKREAVDTLVRKFNSQLLPLGISKNELELNPESELQHVFDRLQQLLLDYRAKVREIEQEGEILEAQKKRTEAELHAKKEDMKRMDESIVKLKEEGEKKQLQWDNEDAALSSKIEEKKSYLLSIRERGSTDLAKLQREAEECEKKVDEAKKLAEEKLGEKVELIKSAQRRGEDFLKEKIEQRDQFVDRFKKLVDEEKEKNEALAKEIEGLTKKVDEFQW